MRHLLRPSARREEGRSHKRPIEVEERGEVHLQSKGPPVKHIVGHTSSELRINLMLQADWKHGWPHSLFVYKQRHYCL
jgi:hypothetical protein